MDDFQPEDELKPDTSDRPAPRGKKAASASKLPISKQHLTIAVGILVLLLLVLGIGSALNGSSSEPKATGQSAERNIDLSGNEPTSNSQTQSVNTPNTPLEQPTNDQSAPPANATQNNTVDNDSTMSSTADTAVTSQPSSVAALPTGPATLDRNAKLSSTTVQPPVTQQQSVSTSNTSTRHNNSSTAHARPKVEAQHSTPRATHQASTERRPQATRHEVAKAETPVQRKTPAKQPPVTTVTEPTRSAAVADTKRATTAPTSGKGYTVQLSSASREDTLDAWAKQQKLSGYRIYKTSRNGQPWYVLVSGNYRTPAEAKSAISSLPEAVKAQSPWVKPMSQLH